MQHANISRCNFMKALHRSAPLEVAHGPAPFRYRSTRLMVRGLQSGTLDDHQQNRPSDDSVDVRSLLEAEPANLGCIGSF